MTKTLTVDLGNRSYPIHIGPRLLELPELLLEHIHGKQVLVVTNTTVAPLYLEKIMGHLAGLEATSLVLPDGESHKTMDTLNSIFDKLLSSRHNRTTTLIALGGGVVGDMTGFAAACYQRGVNFIQIPTTLLSQVDSSVGGKTGVNHPQGKNMIGAFYQPQCVIIDSLTLSTLPAREISAGLAEVIKYGLLGNADFFAWLVHNIDALQQRQSETIIEAIYTACSMKAAIVAADEKEQGSRALLNLGHTFGHAIETQQGYGTWLHGEAVGAGMAMAADLSLRMGWLTHADVLNINQLLSKAGLPTQAPKDMNASHFMQHMKVDKKVTNGKLRLVLLKQIGNAIVTDQFDPAHLEATLNTANA